MQRLTRRRLLQYGLGAGLALAWRWALPARVAGAAPPRGLKKYVSRLPVPGAGIELLPGCRRAVKAPFIDQGNEWVKRCLWR
jgi:hypothetical protein